MSHTLCSKLAARIVPVIIPLLALGASLPPAPAGAQAIPGRVVSATSVSQGRFEVVSRTFDEAGNEIAADDWFEERMVVVEQDGMQRCTRLVESWKVSAGAPVETSEETRCAAAPEDEFQTVMEVITGTMRWTSESPPGVVSQIDEETRSGYATFTLTAEFPAPRAGMRFARVRVRPGVI